MLDLNVHTFGKSLEGLESVRQSIERIITTPIGTRCTNREFGSRVFEYIDKNMTNLLPVRMAVLEAIQRWEKRVIIDRVQITTGSDGVMRIDVFGVYRPTGEALTVEVGI